MAMEPTEMQTSFSGLKVFITGGTGFLGKGLLEKIVRSLPVSHVYLLIRSKKDVGHQERLQRIFDSQLFDAVRRERPDFARCITAVNGDLLAPALGLSAADRAMLVEEVNVIFHCAATVRFDEQLATAARVNVAATKDMLELAKAVRDLRAMVHVSTAYSHCPRTDIAERFYAAGVDADRLLRLVDLLDEDDLETLKARFLKKWPNTYTFTKAIGENLVRDEGARLPLAIVRPSIVASALQEPLCGYIDAVMGLTGLAIATGLGVVRALLMDGGKKVDFVPSDIVVNNILAIAYGVMRGRSNGTYDSLKIFNCVSGARNPLLYRDFLAFCLLHNAKTPSTKIIWYPCSILSTNWTYYKLMNVLFNELPAYVLDAVGQLTGEKAGASRIVDKINKLMDTMRFFTLNEWDFNDTNNQQLFESLSDKDKQVFPFDTAVIDWQQYVGNFVRGCRIFMLKDPMETVPEGISRYKKMQIAHYFIVSFVVLLFLYVLVKFLYIFL